MLCPASVSGFFTGPRHSPADRENVMKNARALLPALILAACAGTYEPATDGPTITLRVEPDIKPGIPVISYHDLTLYLDQMASSKIPGTDLYEARSLGYQKIEDDGNKEPFVLPATRP